jgi:hypothetical protein
MTQRSKVKLINVELSEPNVLLLDYAEFCWNDGPWEEKEEILRIDNIMRGRLGIPLKLEAYRQPYSSLPESRKPRGTLKLLFAFDSEVDISNPRLALEKAKDVQIILDGLIVPSAVESWRVDEELHTVKLPSISSGSHKIELTYAYGLMTNLERIYILGDFASTSAAPNPLRTVYLRRLTAPY